ncbi:MAG: hypothetical protein KBG15_05905 [Kofleriaceae bacterium]|nr:hypothetical protein [Kofleriaceae bacterium]
MRKLLWLLLTLAVALSACQGAARTTGGNDSGVGNVDNDGDGFTPTGGDCNDADPAVFPGAAEVCTDGIDNNCDGAPDKSDYACMTPCERATADRASVGCEYLAVDTNALGGPYGITVSNVNDQPVHVKVEARVAGAWQVVANGEFDVAPLSVNTVVPPRAAMRGSAILVGNAFRITATLPIIAYQFAPIDGAGSFLSDASLLLPISALDTVHLVPAWPSGIADGRQGNRHPAHLQIAAPAAVSVTVTIPDGTQGGTLPAIAPGGSQTFTLAEGDVLQLDALAEKSLDGAYVTSTGPVAVFSSNDCADVPAQPGACCCEHLEEQIFGLQTWGKTYTAAQMPRRAQEPSVWRILAQQDNTTVQFSFSPNVTGLPASVTLNARQRVEYLVAGGAGPGDFFVSADKPVHVNQFTVGSALVDGVTGDPDMIQAVPVEQFLNRYVILAPSTWINDFVVLTRTAGKAVRLDGVEVAGPWVAVGSSGFETTVVSVADGSHVLDAADRFGVSVSGYDSYDSYSYPGGLNQKVINPVE